MLSQEILKLEDENRRLKVLVKQMMGDIPKVKNCASCKHYIRHYGRQGDAYYPLDIGHCVCCVPIKKRKGKKEPSPEETCLCFQEK